MTKLPIICISCGKRFLRSRRRINEGLKNKWRAFCSLLCQSSYKNKQKTLYCGNPHCDNTFKRSLREIPLSGICFCSRSCSAIVNNPKSPKRLPKTRTCFNCGVKFVRSRRKYCSTKCIPRKAIITKQQIIETIQIFYKRNNRIPVKREFFHYKAARSQFGTWNNAVKEAGFDPNPVRFAKKYIANDGHKCDSLAEKIIDDWFYARKIIHERNIPYNKSKMTADFKVSGVLIEFLGLKGELEEYDRLVAEKEKLWKEKRMKIIQVYPKDLFPTNNLDTILSPLFK